MPEELIARKHDYIQRMSIDEVTKFMSEEQEWNLSRICQVTNLTKIKKGGDFSSKPVLVQGTDGVMYGGVAAVYLRWQGIDKPSIALHFALGKNQTDSTPLDDRMKELGFHKGTIIPIYGADPYQPRTGTLEIDYDTVQKRLEGILKGDSPNDKIIDADYIMPTSTLFETSLPLSDPSGSFIYHLKIRDALKLGIETGSIPKELAPPKAPYYVREIVASE